MAPEVLSTGFIASSPAMREVLQQIELVRDSAVAVLLTGARGTGKEFVARTIHGTGVRRSEPFVRVDCAELPGEVLEPVLFGDRDEGRFELARAGTLFLDHIDALPLALQERLRHVLERGTLTRAGGKRIVPVRARIVAATEADLRAEVQAGRFRRDLFCRLNVFPIALPPLRARREDIPALAQRFLQRHGADHVPPVAKIEERALAALKAYDWPGNLVELEEVVAGAVEACRDGGVLTLDLLPPQIRARAPEVVAPEPAPPAPFLDGDTIIPLAELERQAILHALKVTGGNVTRAARALGIGRATMYRKLDRFKLAGAKR